MDVQNGRTFRAEVLGMSDRIDFSSSSTRARIEHFFSVERLLFPTTDSLTIHV